MPGSSKQTTKTEQKTDPWAPAQPGLQSILNRAGEYGGNSAMFTPTYSGYTRDAVAGMGQLGRMPSQAASMYSRAADTAAGGLDTGYGNIMATARGDFLGNNPFLDATLNTATSRAADAVNRQFSGMGRYGSGAHTGTLTRELGNIEASARLDNYNRERGNQINASNTLAQYGLGAGDMAGAATGAEAQRLGYLASAGQSQDAMDAANREAPLRALEWQKAQTVPIAQLGQQSSGTSTQSVTPSMGQQIMGGAMMGLGLLTGNPMGGSGGILGALRPGGSSLGNMMAGAPQGYGSSWTPWTRYG